MLRCRRTPHNRIENFCFAATTNTGNYADILEHRAYSIFSINYSLNGSHNVKPRSSNCTITFYESFFSPPLRSTFSLCFFLPAPNVPLIHGSCCWCHRRNLNHKIHLVMPAVKQVRECQKVENRVECQRRERREKSGFEVLTSKEVDRDLLRNCQELSWPERKSE